MHSSPALRSTFHEFAAAAFDGGLGYAAGLALVVGVRVWQQWQSATPEAGPATVAASALLIASTIAYRAARFRRSTNASALFLFARCLVGVVTPPTLLLVPLTGAPHGMLFFLGPYTALALAILGFSAYLMHVTRRR